jgi:hypothetical protein
MNPFASLNKILMDLADPRINKFLILSTLLALLTLVPLLAWLGFASYNWLSDLLTQSQVTIPGLEKVVITGTLLTALHVLAGIAITLGMTVGLFGLFAILTLAVLGFFTEQIVKAVRNKHYPGVVLSGNLGTWGMGARMAWGFLLHILVLPLLVPFFLLPAINGPVFMLWLHSLFRFTLVLDVASTVWPREYIRLEAPVFGLRWAVPTGLCYLGTLVPLVNFVMPFAAVIWMSHLMLEEKARLDGEPLARLEHTG